MRYLLDSTAFTETLEIAASTGHMPPAFLRPEVLPRTRLELEPVTVLAAGRMHLVLAERTASWVLLDRGELALALALDGRPAGELPDPDAYLSSGLVEGLYRRGLLRVVGVPGLPPTLLDAGALHHDGYLVEILLTQKCNLACPYCLAEAGPAMSHLDRGHAFAAVDAAFGLPAGRPLCIQLSGGEPFVNLPLFTAVVEYVEHKRQTTGREAALVTQSNGTLITDEIGDFLANHQVDIGISCDGPEPVTGRSRPLLGGQSSLERALRGMRILRRHGIAFGVITVLSRANVSEPTTLADFFNDTDITSVKINPVNAIGDAQESWRTMGISPVEYYDFLDRFIDHVLDNGYRLAEANLREYLQHLTRRVQNYRCMRSNCGAGRSFFLVDSRGDLYPCAHSAGIPSWGLGSVTDAAAGLVTMGQRNDVVRQLDERLVERLPETQRCPWRHFCEGGCAVNAFQQAGTVRAREPLCDFYERLYPRLLERLAEDPDRFQRLLDLNLGAGVATVVSISTARLGSTVE